MNRQREIDRLLSLSILFSGLLVATRMIHTGKNTFLFLVWNLFLAWVPYLISARLARIQLPTPSAPQRSSTGSSSHSSLRSKLVFTALSLAWLLCIPNAFYIITDLFHLGDKYNDHLMPQWYDLALILSFVWNGLLLGVLSVRQMEKNLKPLLPVHHELAFLYPVMWLNALGVYTGRYLRFNSWDLITDPFQLCRDIAHMLYHPLRSHYAWGMIFCYSILMTLMYLMIKKISRVLN